MRIEELKDMINIVQEQSSKMPLKVKMNQDLFDHLVSMNEFYVKEKAYYDRFMGIQVVIDNSIEGYEFVYKEDVLN